MLTVIAIIVCASGITTVLIYHDYKRTCIEMIKINENKVSRDKEIDEFKDRYKKIYSHIFFVFPMFIVLYSLVIWIVSQFLK